MNSAIRFLFPAICLAVAVMDRSGQLRLLFGMLFIASCFYLLLSSVHGKGYRAPQSPPDPDYSGNYQDEDFEEESDEDDWSAQDNVESSEEQRFCKILELKGKMTKVEIKKQYRSMIAKYHPDKVNSLGEELRVLASNKTKAINEAYEFFRAKYDL